MVVPGRVVVGGGTGFIGTALCNLLIRNGYDVVIVSRVPGPFCMTWNELERSGLPRGTTAVVNLAGQNVLDVSRRWTSGFQQTVRASRINTTSALASAISRADVKPAVFVATSAIGYYPASEENQYDETSPGGDEGDYFASLCRDWESSAKLPNDCGVRQVTIRTGVVLGRRGGMIQQLYWPFYLGLGGPVSNGRQYLPWIHISDIARMFLFAIEEDKVTGVLNGVAPGTITNGEFAKAFGRSLWRPALIPVPSFIFNLVYGPERAAMITRGQKVIPRRVTEYNFHYNYPDIDSACREFSPLFYIDDV